MSKSSGSKKKLDGRDLPADLAPGSVEKTIETISELKTEQPGKAISLERWQQAQKAEREQHTLSYMEGLLHYANSYKHYFRFVGLGNDLGGLNVIEVGPADFPALNECKGEGKLFVVEPMPSEHLERICKEKGIILVTSPFESLDFTTDNGKPEGIIEVWLFNVMQHVINPDKFIEQAKGIADRIRFFEPIDEPITEYHPHTYTLKDYQGYFGDSVNLYVGGTVPGFHEASCAYGVWVK